jgi:hypothetical protein
MTLERLVIDYRSGELVVRALYQRSLEASPNPGTVKRRREVSELVRTGLQDALEALAGDVTMAGTSGFSVREDIMVASAAKRAPEKQPKEESAA